MQITHQNDNQFTGAAPLRWVQEASNLWKSADGTYYLIAAFRIGTVTRYRPSIANRFIADFCDSLDHAKRICTNNFMLTGGATD